MSSKALAADYSLGQDGLAVALKNLIAADTPAMVWGPPGMGKSAVARSVASELGMEYLDVRALLLDPVDLRGIPWRDENDRTQWAPPAFLPEMGSTTPILLNLEELPSAPQMVQAALYQLVFDPRQLGEYILPESVRIMACGNREEDRGAVKRMLAPLASRFIHIDAECDPEAWIEWAISADLAMEVVFFLKFRPDALMQFDPTSKEKAFPCPRTWEFVSKVVNAGNRGSTMVDLAVLRGAIGEGAAVEFASFLEVFRSLPVIEDVFNDPEGVKVPEDPSAMIALCGALSRKAEDHRMDSVVAFAKRDDVRPELGEFLVNMSTKYNPDSRYTKAWNVWQSYVSNL